MLKGRPSSSKSQSNNNSPTMVGTSAETTYLEPPERAKKKLSFREPEIMGYYMQMKGVTNRLSKKIKACRSGENKAPATCSPTTKSCMYKNSASDDNQRNNEYFGDSTEDLSLESQAMRVVKTIGQAFDECKRQSMTSPPNGNVDQEMEVSVEEKDIGIHQLEKSKKDLVSTSSSTETLLTRDQSGSPEEQAPVKSSPRIRPIRLDISPASPIYPNSNSPSPFITNGVRRCLMNGGEMHTSPLTETPVFGSPLMSTHHELRLLREQNEQQCQQTQAAVAQVLLLRDQLSAETGARIEAQAHTQQLLSHNTELLQHIASLVALLQKQENLHAQQQQRHLQQQQQQHFQFQSQFQQPTQFQNMQNLPSHVPQINNVLRDTHATPNGVPSLQDFQDIEAFRYLPSQLPAVNIDNLKISSSSYLPTSPLPRHHIPSNATNFGCTSGANEQFQAQLIRQLQSLNTMYNHQMGNSLPGSHTVGQYAPPQISSSQKTTPSPSVRISRVSSNSTSPVSDSTNKVLDERLQYETGYSHLIKPLSQGKTITATDDAGGRVKIIVPVNEDDIPVSRLEPPLSEHKRIKEVSTTKLGNQESDTNLHGVSVRGKDVQKCNSHKPVNGPVIMRTTSEKVPNRSELMLQVERTGWARHTTK